MTVGTETYQAPETLLPTLRSRAHILSLNVAERKETLIDAGAFLAATPHKRLDMLKPLLEKDEDEKRNIGGVLAFLASLERACAKNPDAQALSAVYRARKYASDKGALLKPLLEQIALLS